MHIFFSVGEPSGDLHAAKLVTELQRREPRLTCSGFGGPLMEAAGCKILYRLTNLAVMGILPVIPLLFQFIRLARLAKKFLAEHRPDAVVVVDFPGFNWWIARAAKSLGIPVFYYLPPQLWAWGPWRVRRMKKFVDHVLSALPFEVEWYRKRGIAAEFVGHPFFDEVAERPLDHEFIAQHASPSAGEIGPQREIKTPSIRSGSRETSDAGSLTTSATGRLAPAVGDIRTVAVLPGSRNHEISQNFLIQIKVMKKLHCRLPGVRFLVASYKESQHERCAKLLAERAPELPVTLHVGKTSEIIQLADACLMVSGSVSLEVMARQTPAVVVYRISRALYWLCQVIITCQYISLPNLIAKRPITPEFVPIDDPRWCIDIMTDILNVWLTDDEARAQQKAALKRMCEEVATSGATANAANAILQRLIPKELPAQRHAA